MSGGLEITAVLLATEFLEVLLNTISKVAMTRGMNNFVYNVYSTALGVLFLLPLTVVFHRITSSPPPNLTFPIFCKICLLGTLGYCVSMFMFFGIGYSSPTLASAMNNLIPACTFILARITRMEKLDLTSKSSQAKALGTIISVSGAFVVTFYNGPAITFTTEASRSSSVLHEALLQSPQPNWVIGGCFLAAGTLSLAVLFIVQTWIIKDYPAAMMATLIGNAFSIIISTTVALIVVRDPNAWKLRPDFELVSIVYSAIFMVGFRNVVSMWVLRKKGPVFVSMFKPVGMVIALVLGISFLGDTLYLGSVTGAIIIALGFYSVLWGKAEEEKAIHEDNSGEKNVFYSTSDKLPLLQKKGGEK